MNRRILQLAIFISLLSATLLAATALFAGSTSLAWDQAADVIVLRATRDGRTTATIWGDGYITWTVQDVDGHAVLQQATLREAKLRLLLGYITQAGFFEWQPAGDTNAGQCLMIQLVDRSQTVCGVENLPDVFFQVVDMVASGVGEAGETLSVAQTP